MPVSIFEKLILGLKVVNDNLIIANEKLDAVLASLSYEEAEPNGVPGAAENTENKEHPIY